MKVTLPPTLSEYLLLESEKFPLYPEGLRRSRGSVLVQKRFEEKVRQLVEWRKTFALRPKQESDDFLEDPVSLDQVYCRDLLRAVPGMVERTRTLAQLTLSEIRDSRSFVYLREAANCFILGFPQAAIALSRAAIEASLKSTAAKHLPRSAVDAAGLYELINDFAARGKPPLLSPTLRKSANKVRVSGDDVLHGKPADSGSALEVIEAARAVILELEGKKGRS